jgi:riboflavin kinase / FMN adenylyltransferase
MQGEVETANQYLSEPYEMNGLVVKGNALGRQMEFPTANLDLETNLKLIPKQGVYAVQVVLQDSSEWMGMMNIGTKPTLGEDAPVSLEVHLLNFEGDLYDQRIKVRFLRFLREEQRFDNLNSLKSQLKQDALSTRDYFNSLV